MKRIRVKLEGITPLVISKGPYLIAPDQDPREVAEVVFSLKEEKAGISFGRLFACLEEAGKKVKFDTRRNITTTQGTRLTFFLFIEGDFFPFEGDPQWEVDIRKGEIKEAYPTVFIGQKFKEWSFVVKAKVDERLVSLETVRQLFERAGRIGMASFRLFKKNPGPFGRFRVAEWEVEEIE